VAHKSTQHFFLGGGGKKENREKAPATVGANCCFNRNPNQMKFMLTLPFGLDVATNCTWLSGFFGAEIVVVLLVAAAKLTCCTMPTECRRQMHGKIVVQSLPALAAQPSPSFPLGSNTNSTKMPDTPTKLRDGARPANRVQPNVAARTQTQVVPPPRTTAHRMPFKLHTHPHTHTHREILGGDAVGGGRWVVVGGSMATTSTKRRNFFRAHETFSARKSNAAAK